MADVVRPAVRSAMMSGIRGKNTQPELELRKGLFRRGFRYRLHLDNLPGRPDIVIRKRKVAVFVHGCFWHSHQGCRYFKIPESNRSFWQLKLKGNGERDKRSVAALLATGWRVAVVWECAIRTNSLQATDAVAAFIERGRGYVEIMEGEARSTISTRVVSVT